LADFYRAERKCFVKKPGSTFSTASMDDAKSLYTNFKKRNPDVLFFLMCHAFVKEGRKFFKKYPKSPVMNLHGEI
jgi:hypothetical protein